MRILYMSDLHLEMESPRLTIPGWRGFPTRHRRLPRHPSRGPLLDDLPKPDLVVLAGDIHNGLRGIVYARQLAAYLEAPVVMVAGNHEYYHHDAAVLLPALRAASAASPGVHFLENAAMTLQLAGQSVKILGCTLWTDFALHGDAERAMLDANLLMNDYVLVNNGALKLTPWDTRGFHEASRRWLTAELAATPADVKRVLVTHHAPTALALGKRRGAVAPAYATELVGAYPGLDLWIHGHTHFRHETVIAGTRLVSAPRGYVGHDGRQALRFRPGLAEL